MRSLTMEDSLVEQMNRRPGRPGQHRRWMDGLHRLPTEAPEGPGPSAGSDRPSIRAVYLEQTIRALEQTGIPPEVQSSARIAHTAKCHSHAPTLPPPRTVCSPGSSGG